MYIFLFFSKLGCLQWFSLPFRDFWMLPIILFTIIDQIYRAETSSQTDERVKLVKPENKRKGVEATGPSRAPSHGVDRVDPLPSVGPLPSMQLF